MNTKGDRASFMLNTCPILSALKHNLHFSNSYNINIFGLDIRMLFIWHIIYILSYIFIYFQGHTSCRTEGSITKGIKKKTNSEVR